MRHHMTRTNRNEISGAHDSSRGESVSVACSNLLDERQAHINLPLNKDAEIRLRNPEASLCDAERQLRDTKKRYLKRSS
jgi:hypothetical protein